jgi:hypothetical protein
MRIVPFFATILLFFLLVDISPSQEVIYEQPFQINYDGPAYYTHEGFVVFNGVEHGYVYSQEYAGDADYEIYFRRLKADGTPTGPHKRIATIAGFDRPLAIEWDGSAYLIAGFNVTNEQVYLLRVSRDGELLRIKELDGKFWCWLPGPKNDTFNCYLIKVIGETMFFFFTDGRVEKGARALLVKGDKTLTGDLTVKTLPKENFKNAFILGVTYDTEGFLVLVGERDPSDEEINDVRLIRIDYLGRVVGSPMTLESDIMRATFLAGPVFYGKGYMIIAAKNYAGGAKHRSLVIDFQGKTLYGPNDLGWAASHFIWRNPLWNGDQVSCFATGVEMFLVYFNKKGGFAHDPIPFAGSLIYPWFSPTQALTGTATTVTFSASPGGAKSNVYSNQLSLPAGITKPKVVYFDAGAEYLGQNKRVLVWSAIGNNYLKIQGKGVKLKRLPPVGCALVTLKADKTKLTATANGPGGKAKKTIVITR